MLTGAIMVPHPPIALHEVGRGEERKIQDILDAYDKAARFAAAHHPDTLIITSPHTVMYRDYFNVSGGSSAYGDMGRFRASSVSFEVNYDEQFTHNLEILAEGDHFPAGCQYDRDKMLDHGTMVPLYFLQRYVDLKKVKIVRIGLSGFPLTDHYKLGMYLKRLMAASDKNYFFVASGDLSHCQKKEGPYGFAPEGPEYDVRIMKTMGTGNFEELLEYDPAFLEKAKECGHRSFTILAGALDQTGVKPEVLGHSAKFGVGYGIITYELTGKDAKRNFLDQYQEKQKKIMMEKKKDCDPYVQLAWKSVEAYVSEHKKISIPADTPEELLHQKAGAFVSIHENGELRGCIGTISAVRKNLAEEIIQNAISACSRDPRFSAIQKEELPFLEISVDVLGKAEPLINLKHQDVKKYGIIVSKGMRRGLLLPDLEGVDTPYQQYSIACRKAGIEEEEAEVKMERFQVIRHV